MGVVSMRRVVLALAATAAVMAVGAAGASAASVSDVGPVGWDTGSGDSNLGVLNQGARTLNFDDGWRFKLVNTKNTSAPTGVYGNSSDPRAAAPSFPDTTWPELTLPHDWSITLNPQPDQSNATGYFPGGLGWYRKTFTLPLSMTTGPSTNITSFVHSFRSMWLASTPAYGVSDPLTRAREGLIKSVEHPSGLKPWPHIEQLRLQKLIAT